MTNIVQSKYKISRRLGVSIWGEAKDAFNKRNYRPGQQGAANPQKPTEHSLHLNAKQRLKNFYGRVTEKQFRNEFKKAAQKKGNVGDNFVGMLETRIDSAIYRMGIAKTIFSARQLVSHGHIQVNGKKLDIPSAKIKVNDIIEVREKSKYLPVIQDSVKAGTTAPDYFEFDAAKLTGKLVRLPQSNDVNYPFDPDLNLIIEFYSK